MNGPPRFEFKFLVTAPQRDEALAVFNGALRPDANGASGGVYPVVSLYYDTPDRRCFWEAWRGMPSRRKLRVRVYGTADGGIAPTSFVEVKHKFNGLGVKRRVQTSLSHALAIGAGHSEADSFAAPEASVVREVHRLVHEDGFRPVCMMRYRRHAYSLDAEEGTEPLRITFDDQLGGRFRDLEIEPDDQRCDFRLLAADHFVMEMKGAGAVPYSIARWLAKSGLSPRGFSKYCAALRLHAATPSP